MSKTLKRTLIVILTALLCFSCAILLLNPNTATVHAAEETNKSPTVSNNNFEMEDVVVDNYFFAAGRYLLTYGVTLKNPDLANLSNILCKTTSNWWGRSKTLTNEARFRFSLYRNNEDGNTEEKLVEYIIWLRGYGANDEGTFGKVIAKKDYSYYSEKITFGTTGNPIDTYTEKNVLAANGAVINALEDDNYEILSYGIATGGFPVKGTNQTVPFIVETDSPVTNYHVEFKYETSIAKPIVEVFNFDPNYQYNAENLENEGQCVQSSFREWRDSDPDGFAETFSFYSDETLTRANDIIYKVTNLTIRLKYLEQIGDTPFAEAKYKTVDVRAVDGMITETSVLAALDVKKFEFWARTGLRL